MEKRQTKATRLDYRPTGRDLDLEIFPFASIQRRGTPRQIRAPHRYAFHMLILVSEGAVTQMVDFKPVACAPGSMLIIRPGQVHSFGSEEGWEGWIVLFRSEFLPAASETTSELVAALGLDRLPDHLALSASELSAVTEAIARMNQDAMSHAPPADVHALLRHQLCALLLRLAILRDRLEGAATIGSRGLQRFGRFRKLVERNYSGWHQVAEYADALGCTEKSLTRAAIEATGQSAKSIIAARITLEAKRLLAHTDLPVYLIAESLGFDEATNFAKFFRREGGCSPGEFREQHVTLNA